VVATASATTGERANAYTYDAYGQIGLGEGASQPFRYTRRCWDEKIGLYYYRARYYSAKLGCFMQTDPMDYEDNMNLFTRRTLSLARPKVRPKDGIVPKSMSSEMFGLLTASSGISEDNPT